MVNCYGYMDDLPTPVLDNHLHLHAEGKGVEAVKEFARAGGTHLLVVNRPSWHIVDSVEDVSAFETTFEVTLDLVDAASAVLPGQAWPVLGVHPALISQLVDHNGWSVDRACELMMEGIDLAGRYVWQGDALALKSGRPHYDVSAAVWDVSNEVIGHAARTAADRACALQLHTEGGDDFDDIATIASDNGLDPRRVVKHFSTGPITGVTPSVIARGEAVRSAVAGAERFLLETDYLDDPGRPGAVLGPKLVPRRSRELAADGHLDALRTAHIETPREVYGIDTEATLTE